MTRIVADWVTAPASRAVMDALGEGWFVGGCVRNALLGAPVADIDIATPLVPEVVIERLEHAGLKAVPTGLKHGTVTAVHDGKPVEVTTFRADVATDGRHAEVAFTTDMAVDAGRRDFTMNALYADRDGVVIDPLGGLTDLDARQVRFIGRAEDRIREDYLRILRFFRFHAWYGANGIDPDGLAACAELADGVDRLARERVGWEMRKLLSAPDPAPVVASMAVSGVLTRVLPGADPMMLAPLVHLEHEAGVEPDWIARLATLGGEDVGSALRLSNAESAAMTALHHTLQDAIRIEANAYRHGADAARRAALLSASASGTGLPDNLSERIAHGASARLPVSASDFIASGMTPGPALGDALARAETLWIDSLFSLDKPALLAEALS